MRNCTCNHSADSHSDDGCDEDGCDCREYDPRSLAELKARVDRASSLPSGAFPTVLDFLLRDRAEREYEEALKASHKESR